MGYGIMIEMLIPSDASGELPQGRGRKGHATRSAEIYGVRATAKEARTERNTYIDSSKENTSCPI